MSELTPKVTKDSFEQDVLKSDIPVLVDFWAEWCGPCRMIAPILEEIAPEYQGKLKIVKLNVDTDGEAAAPFGVQSIPTLVFIKNGQEVDRVTGAVPKDQIKSHIDKILEA